MPRRTRLLPVSTAPTSSGGQQDLQRARPGDSKSWPALATSIVIGSLALGALALTSSGCCKPCVSVPPQSGGLNANGGNASAGNPLQLAADSPILKNDVIAKRVLSSPHNYFRAINIPFAKEVCRRFKPVMVSLPAVNLHGDAHLEQFAVTPDGAGLADFDDSVSGPPIIDLVRFGVSIDLTCNARGWGHDRDAIIDAFLEAYESGIQEAAEPAPPAVVGQLREQFNKSRSTFLSEVEQRMDDGANANPQDALRGFKRYVQLMRRIAPERPESFYKIQRWGRLSSRGIGSATTRRYVARIAGPTAAPDDDIILEAKELRDMSAVPCVEAPRGNALRVIAGSMSFARHPDPFLAIIPRGLDEASGAPPWWVQSWIANYVELKIHGSLASADDMRQVVQLVGSQMAQGHTNMLPPPYDVQLRELVKIMLKEQKQQLRQTIAEMAEMTLAARELSQAAR